MNAPIRQLARRLLLPILAVLVAPGLVGRATAQPPAAPSPAPVPPVLGFEEQAVVVSGLAPGGRAAVLGVGRGFNGYVGTLVRRWEVLADDDGDGAVRLELGGPVQHKSVWAAVDLATGELALGAPEGFAVQEIGFPGRGIGAARKTLTDARRYLEALWVRPGGGTDAGAWQASFGDGGATDDDGVENRSVRAVVTAFTPVEAGTAGPPEKLAGGDVVVGVDAETLEIYAARLAG